MLKDLVGAIKSTTVQGKEYIFYPNYTMRRTYAVDPETGEAKAISSEGYVSNDLRVRKEIARVFGLNSFRK